MADKERLDPKGRKLRTGESYSYKRGRLVYRFKVTEDHVTTEFTSYTLTSKDPIPAGVRQHKGESLREKEEKYIYERMNALDHKGGNMTVLELVKRYVSIQSKDKRETTCKGYRTQLNFMQENAFASMMGSKRIKDVNIVEAEEWMMDLHKKEGRSYSSLHTLKGMLHQSFIKAKRAHWVLDNPFDFSLTKEAYGGQKTREAISRYDAERYLDFLQRDKHFCKYYDGVYILFNTGLRISEFCGLIPDDIDFDQHVIHVRRQLLRVYNEDEDINLLYIAPPKSKKGTRIIPMTDGVERAFRHVINNRKTIKETIVWDQYHKDSATGFLWLDKNDQYEVAQHWQNHIRWSRDKFNRIYKEELPPISPHICRHTFCSNCASAGMSPKTLQTIMGHASISITMDIYTNLEDEDIIKSFESLNKRGRIGFGKYTASQIVPDDDDDDEGEVDLAEEADDDDEE